MPKSVSAQIEKALTSAKRSPVVWLELQDCAGCSEGFLRASSPTAVDVILNT